MLSYRYFLASLPTIGLVTLGLLLTSGCADKGDVAPPVAKVIPKADTLYGDIRVDNYHWLRKKTDPAIIEYLEAENEYTEQVMKPTKRLQEKLYKEIVGRIKETDLSVPEKKGVYYYYTRTEESQQYPIYCRKKGSLDAKEEVLLDQNELAEGREQLALGAYKISPNHQLLAYSIDTTGGEIFSLFVKDLNTGELLADRIDNVYYSAEWANDNRTIFYSTLDEAKRPFKLFRHPLGTDPQEDELVFHEKDEAFHLSFSKSRSEDFLMITLGSMTTTEVRYLKADDPTGRFKVLHPRQHELEYHAEHLGDVFYIMTNDGAKNFKVVKAAVKDPSRKNWQEVLPHREAVKVDGLDAFKNHLVVYERESGLKKIRVINIADQEFHYVDFPEPVYTFQATGNPEFDTSLLRFNYTSLITPRSVYDYDMDARSRELLKQYEVLGGYDPADYQSERISAEAPDGTTIPISLVYRKGMVKDGSNPLLLYGYGSYGASIELTEPTFSSNRLSLLDRGFIYAIAHIRGGGEMGRYWYEDGKLLHKKNTFTDFIACAAHLIASDYTSRDRLAINGSSAGGLLMGAVTNMRPDLFKVVIAKVPFVDVLNTMLDATIPLTVIEYEEWGNPTEKEYYDYIKSYSPYDNVEAKAYPNILITAGLNDPRVQYWEPAKWTAKLRALKTDNNRLLLKTEMGKGHFGASGRYDYLRDVAFDYAFIIDVLGLKK